MEIEVTLFESPSLRIMFKAGINEWCIWVKEWRKKEAGKPLK